MSNAPEQKCFLFTVLEWTFGVIQSKNDYAIRKLFKLHACFLSIFVSFEAYQKLQSNHTYTSKMIPNAVLTTYLSSAA